MGSKRHSVISKPESSIKSSKQKRISRRSFLEQASTATGVLAIGCQTNSRLSQVKSIEDTTIVRAAIYPGIGIARVGNSEHSYFIGPELVEPPFTEMGASRDASGAMKRQAARFRIYGYNASGEVVAEITPALASIEWQVTLANKKASWYQFIVAQDIDAAKDASAPLRNAHITGAARKSLEITPNPITISGINTSGSEYQFDSGKFLDTKVYLGELRTDEVGRLIVLSGKGFSSSPLGSPVYDETKENSFNNADGWFDDTADGPVSATVRIAGQEIPVDPAWLVSCPPNYAPDVISWRTLYDLLKDTYHENGMIDVPTATSFVKDILPIFTRMSQLQWVNKGFALTFGKGKQYDFTDPILIEKLADHNTDRNFRKELTSHFRHPGTTNLDRKYWPWIYGDAFGSYPDSPKINLELSPMRAYHLQRWVDGNYANDWDPQSKSFQTFAEVPLSEQPAMLNQAALHFCIADAFHPGCELTWPLRHRSIFSEPFRIKQRPTSEPESDYGDQLNAKILADHIKGPLAAQGPGGLTRWMALPWQVDTVSCRSGYDPNYDPYLPTFWPARVPNQVLSEAAYAVVMNTSKTKAERLQAFANREHWVRILRGNFLQQISQFVDHFDHMGILEARPGISDDPDFPTIMLVESLPDAVETVAPTTDISGERDPINSYKQAGWESEEQLKEFKSILKLK